MTELSQVSIEDTIIKREVPIVEPSDNLRKTINEMVKYKVATALLEDGDNLFLITSKTCASIIVSNIWRLETVVDRFTLSDLFRGERNPIEPLKIDSPITDAINKILEIRDNYVVEEDGTYYEITGEDALPLYILWEEDLEGKTIGEYASEEVVTVPPTQSAVSTYEKYNSKKLTAAVVINPAHQPIGIVTNRDYTVSFKELMREAERVRPDRDMKINVQVVMKTDVIFEFIDDPFMMAINRMVENDIGHLPVVDEDDEVVGMIYKYSLLQELVKLDEGS